jgi:hypothetical protein
MARKKAAKKTPAKLPTKRRATTPPFPEWEEWSTSKFWSFIRSGLRAKWQRFPSRYAVLAAAKRDYKGDNPRQKYEFKCAKCKKHFPQKEVEVDHIEPVGQLKGWDDLVPFVQKLFVGVEKLRVVCKPCHYTITQKWKAEQKETE